MKLRAGFTDMTSQVSGGRRELINYHLVVDSIEPKTQVRFKGALGQNGDLDIIEAVTPYEKDFAAWKVVAMFQSLDPDAPISVSLYSCAENPSRPTKIIGRFTGRHGGIVKNVDPNNSIGAGAIFD